MYLESSAIYKSKNINLLSRAILRLCLKDPVNENSEQIEIFKN